MGKLAILSNDLRLQESEVYGDVYLKNAVNTNSSTYNELSIHTLEDWYNYLSTTYNLTSSQEVNLINFTEQFRTILALINPHKIKDIQNTLNEDSDLLLWKESTNSISEIFFEDDGEILYRFTDKKTGRLTKSFFNGECDFQGLILTFLK